MLQTLINPMRKAFIAALAALTLPAAAAVAGNYSVSSPDGGLRVDVTTGHGPMTWTVSLDGHEALLPSPMGLRLADGRVLGDAARVRRTSRRSVDEAFATPHYRQAEVRDCYNELTLTMRGYSVQLRAYDDAAAYRFVLTGRASDSLTVAADEAAFNFGASRRAWLPYNNDLRSSDYPYSFAFECYYDEVPLGEMPADTVSITPLLVELDGGRKALVMEGMLENFPGMFLRRSADGEGLKAEHAPVPLQTRVGGFNKLNLVPVAGADHIARVAGNAVLPWRAVAVTSDDSQLPASTLAMRLSEPLRLDDTSWIKPGKVAWDWWNDWGLTGVDFEAGINTATYKHYIDFATRKGLQYVILDEGWAKDNGDIHDINPDVDLAGIINYARGKGIGIILWATWRQLKDDPAGLMRHFADMGVKGLKIDFFDRDDQPLISSLGEMVRLAADNHLLLDLHGMHPVGWQRPYPNLVNYEGVKGLENYKWGAFGRPGNPDQLRYDVTIPFIRQAAGPMDYTPGAMLNSTAASYRPSNDAPMSLGTRTHQAAMYVVYDGALQMMADSPSAYDREPDCADFMAAVPTTFDESRVLDGRVGEYVVIARRKGDVWYVGAMTNGAPRELTVDTSFLTPGRSYDVTVMSDGVNAAKHPVDYRITRLPSFESGQPLHVSLAPGGGWVAVFR